MSAIPAFEIGVWNAWTLTVPYLLLNFGLPPLLVHRKSTFWSWPSYTGLERVCLNTGLLIMGGLWTYSVFLPLAVGGAWFYVGLPIYLLGLGLVAISMRTFISTPAGKPNTTGIYRISRHPMYIGILVLYIGIGITAASWAYLVLVLLLLTTYRIAYMIPEERFCCEEFGDDYRAYMARTPRWIGIPKSG